MKTEVVLHLEKKPFADGHSFGDVGPYERLVGTIEFALDPADPMNANIVDLTLAPRNAKGLVEFTADIDILKPADMARGNGRLFYDVNNRGVRTVLRSFNDGAGGGPEPVTLAQAGNGFLMRQGYTMLWHGWQGDLVSGRGLIAARLPEALEGGKRLRGTIRQEYVIDREGVLSVPLSGSEDIIIPEATDADTRHTTMTVREREADPRVPLSPDEWSFARMEKDPKTGLLTMTPSNAWCSVKGGFQPGWIYELVYQTEGSRVMGLGVVSIRDLVGFLKFVPRDAADQPNPLYDRIKKAYGYGLSLSARLLRQFIYDGYNEYSYGLRAFDGVYLHLSGGGRIFVNTRFAQVGRTPKQHEDHQYPSERYPFAYTAVPDPFIGKNDCILKRPSTDPLVVHTHTGTEYWQRHASLGHTHPGTGEDLAMPDTVRMWALSSFQHLGAAGGENVAEQQSNRMNYNPLLRATLTNLDRWITEGTAPPESVYPHRAEGTLATPEEVMKAFPPIPGLTLPRSHSHLPRWDYGPEFDERGIVSRHPPVAPPGEEYPIKVPQVDADGNELGGIRSPEIAAPIGTHTGWSTRRKGFAEGENLTFNGSFIPFCRTTAERLAKGDPRLSIEERYASHDEYVHLITVASDDLVKRGFLLREDLVRYVQAAKARNPRDPNVPLRPLRFGAE